MDKPSHTQEEINRLAGTKTASESNPDIEEISEIIRRLEKTLKATCSIDFSGEVQLLDWSKSTAKDGPKIKFMLADDEAIRPFEIATTRKGKMAGQLYHVFAIRLDGPAIGEEKGPAKVKEPAKPYGKHASELYRVGFYFSPQVMREVGDPDQYAAWVQTQPSAYSGDFNEWVNGEGRCVAAHVRRVADGAGTGIKNDYAVIPLKQVEEHLLQHSEGESALGGKGWFDQQRAKHLARWMAQTVFGVDSMGHVNPKIVLQWCIDHGIEHLLPPIYKS